MLFYNYFANNLQNKTANTRYRYVQTLNKHTYIAIFDVLFAEMSCAYFMRYSLNNILNRDNHGKHYQSQ